MCASGKQIIVTLATFSLNASTWDVIYNEENVIQLLTWIIMGFCLFVCF